MNDSDTASEATASEFDAVEAFRQILTAEAGDTSEKQKAEPAEESDEETEAQADPSDDAAEEDADEAAETDEDEEADAEEEAPKVLDPQTDKATVRLKLGDTVEEVSLDEVAKGYLRQSDYTRKAQALAETRKEVETNRAAVREEREEYGNLIAALQSKLTQLDEAEKVDWDALYRSDPDAYVRMREAAREREDHLKAIEVETGKLKAQKAAEDKTAHEARVNQTWEVAIAAVPEWGDETTWLRDRDAINAYAKSQGFTQDEINHACSIDPRVLLAMHHAAQHQKLMQNKPKPTKAADSSQPAMRPSKNALTPKPIDERTRAKQRLQKSGSLQDAASVFKHLL